MMADIVLGFAFNTLGKTFLAIRDGFDEDAYRRSFGYDAILRKATFEHEKQTHRAATYFAAVSKRPRINETTLL